MKTTIAFLTLLLAGTIAQAGQPVKKPVNAYLHLSSDSPFTNKPIINNQEKEDTTFEDWALGGVSEVEGGYMVTLVHKKNQGENQIIKPRGTVHSAKDEMKWLNPGDPKGFKVEKVTYGKTSWKDTTVTISSGGKTGTMKFDDKQLAPAASAAPAGRQPGMNGQPQQGQPGGQPQNNNNPPRRRVLPPAPNTPQTQGQGRPNR